MSEFYPFRKATKAEIRKKNFFGAFALVGGFVGFLIPRLSHGSHQELWIAGGVVVGMVLAFVVGLVRGERF
jgi:hypothetical protein